MVIFVISFLTEEIWFPIKNSNLPTEAKRLPPIYKRNTTQLSEDVSTRSKNEFDTSHRKASTSSILSLAESHRNELSMKESSKTEIKQKNQKLVNTQSSALDVKEMPLNPFDFIWYANSLIPKYDETDITNSNPNWSFGSNNKIIYDDTCNEKIRPKSKKLKAKKSKTKINKPPNESS